MPHTASGPGGHCPTASGWLVRTDLGDEPHVLLHLHRRYGVLLQPGGHVEPDEHAWAAVLREVREEAGYDPADLAVLQPWPPDDVALNDGSVITPTPLLQDCHCVEPDVPLYHWDSVFAFVVGGDPPHPPAAGESDDLRWLTLADLDADPAVYPDVRAVARRVVGALDRWDPVPAITYPPTVGTPSP